MNGFSEQLITSKDGPDGSIDATEIERTAREYCRNNMMHGL
ncbi:MAG: hypothetical protein WBH08_09745 [Methanothrix sp.]